MTSKTSLVVYECLYEVLQATAMLLFMLSNISQSRQNHRVAPGVATPLYFPGLPELAICAFIHEVSEDDLYGARGVASQMALKGWIAEVYGLWENKYRNRLKDNLGSGAIHPEMDAFGDLRRIRNDLLHSGTATDGHGGKCNVLKWFRPGERIVLSVGHVLDFLNQTGALAFDGFGFGDVGSCRLGPYLETEELQNWKPAPRIVSVRTQQDGREEEPPFKGVTVVFDNGVFRNVSIVVSGKEEWDRLGDAEIRGGDLVFANGSQIDCSTIYLLATVPTPKDKQFRRLVTGPAIRIRR